MYIYKVLCTYIFCSTVWLLFQPCCKRQVLVEKRASKKRTIVPKGWNIPIVQEKIDVFRMAQEIAEKNRAKDWYGLDGGPISLHFPVL